MGNASPCALRIFPRRDFRAVRFLLLSFIFALGHSAVQACEGCMISGWQWAHPAIESLLWVSVAWCALQVMVAVLLDRDRERLIIVALVGGLLVLLLRWTIYSIYWPMALVVVPLLYLIAHLLRVCGVRSNYALLPFFIVGMAGFTLYMPESVAFLCAGLICCALVMDWFRNRGKTVRQPAFALSAGLALIFASLIGGMNRASIVSAEERGIAERLLAHGSRKPGYHMVRKADSETLKEILRKARTWREGNRLYAGQIHLADAAAEELLKREPREESFPLILDAIRRLDALGDGMEQDNFSYHPSSHLRLLLEKDLLDLEQSTRTLTSTTVALIEHAKTVLSVPPRDAPTSTTQARIVNVSYPGR